KRMKNNLLSIFAILIIVLSFIVILIHSSKTIFVNSEECIGCELCIDICPVNAIEMVDGKAVIDIDRCNNCGECTYVCPTNAIYMETIENAKRKIQQYENSKTAEQPDSTSTKIESKPSQKTSQQSTTQDKKPNISKKNVEVVKKVIYKVEASKCIGCNICVRKCPVDAIEMVNGKAVINTDECIECGICEQVCPTEAITHYEESIKSKKDFKEETSNASERIEDINPKMKASKKTILPTSNEKQKTNKTERPSKIKKQKKSFIKKNKHIVQKVIYKVEASKCIGCNICVRKCPVDAIEMVDRKAVINTDECIECGICEKVCPTDAISHFDEKDDDTKKSIKTSHKKDVEKTKRVQNIPKSDLSSHKSKPKIISYLINKFSCVGCEDCVSICPTDAIEIHNNKAVIDQSKCIDCGECVGACTYDAIEENITE
ncbi:MAG: 4Fe-4S binding protein, partial [Candidatus Cloacimonadota bacterium]|nr:4Fe-4S binding protein [Candidatus Cloacimonadota bacterium]